MNIKGTKLIFMLLLLGLVVLSAAALFNPHSFALDEALFPPNVELMQRYGFSRHFLLQMENQAPGPLYEFVHLPLRAITNLEPQRLRAVNLILFYVVIVTMTAAAYRSDMKNRKRALYIALHVLAVAPLWQVAGLAMTEMPAMVFAALTYYLCCRLLSTKEGPQRTVFTSLVAGLTMGLAILGRTPYLTLLVVFLGIAVWKYKTLDRPLLTILPFLCISLLLTLPVFLTWEGLVPPLQAQVNAGPEPWHGLLAMAYAGIVGLILRPQWFVINYRVGAGLVGLFLLFLLLNVYNLGFEYDPSSASIQKFFGKDFAGWFNQMISPALATLGVYFVANCLYRAGTSMQDTVYLFTLISTVAILATAGKISHQFSSRYVAQAAPFLVLLFVRVDEQDPWKAFRLVAGMTIGFLSLNTYIKVL